MRRHLAPIIRGSWRLAMRARYIILGDGGGCCETVATRWLLKLRARAARQVPTNSRRYSIPIGQLQFLARPFQLGQSARQYGTVDGDLMQAFPKVIPKSGMIGIFGWS
jgi:hypothetical protein